MQNYDRCKSYFGINVSFVIIYMHFVRNLKKTKMVMYDVFIKKEIEMFEIFLFQLACCCEKLELIAVNHKREIENTDSVISALSSLTGLEQPISDLRQKKKY